VPTRTLIRQPMSPERERELREQLGITDTATAEELAAILRCSIRTVERLDLPYWIVANRRIYDLRGSAKRLRELRNITASTADGGAEGALPPGARYRLRLQREREAEDEPAPA
jgi:hypothetical protein